MAINFKEIPSDIEEPQEINTRTVLEELNARQYLLNERTVKCDNIKPLYARKAFPKNRYYYRYFCVCPRYNPKYVCKHNNNIIVDRDFITKEEHIVYLATPRPNFAATRKMPRYFVKKTIIANCTPRIIRLANPNKKQVTNVLNNFNNVLSKRHKRTLKNLLKPPPDVEYTTIMKAVEMIREEKRLKRVAKRKEKFESQNLKRKIIRKEEQQIKRIVYAVFEHMKEFLSNDQFLIDENSPLGAVIFEALKEFSDKDFPITNNLREYQKILAYNLAIWINKFIANLNIQAAENGPQFEKAKPTEEFSTFLPVEDYVSHSSGSEENFYEEDENENCYSPHPITSSERTIAEE